MLAVEHRIGIETAGLPRLRQSRSLRRNDPYAGPHRRRMTELEGPSADPHATHGNRRLAAKRHASLLGADARASPWNGRQLALPVWIGDDGKSGCFCRIDDFRRLLVMPRDPV